MIRRGTGFCRPPQTVHARLLFRYFGLLVPHTTARTHATDGTERLRPVAPQPAAVAQRRQGPVRTLAEGSQGPGRRCGEVPPLDGQPPLPDRLSSLAAL